MSREASMISSRLTGCDSLLFVYGTLRAFVDIPMARWLRSEARFVGSATTQGRLYDLGPYPGMLPARRRGETVVGELYRVVNPRVLRILDRYEAGVAMRNARFVRGRCFVRLSDGRVRAAWVYEYRRRVVSTARIRSGDYRHRRALRAVRVAPYVDGLLSATATSAPSSGPRTPSLTRFTP
jgi:gamma-glutamylcyclotransferase (GGCT)/AIG2-like uncharacterized protein YtfP